MKDVHDAQGRYSFGSHHMLHRCVIQLQMYLFSVDLYHISATTRIPSNDLIATVKSYAQITE
jgi:hypothetical protein